VTLDRELREPGRSAPDAEPGVRRRRPATGFRLGSVRGIEVRAQWSLLILAALIATSIALGLLPTSDEQIDRLSAWVGGVAGALLFVASLLTHELSHSLVARRRGVRVSSITLWLLGGIARLERDAPDARAELRIAIAGPLASFALAGVFGTAALGVSTLGEADAVRVAVDVLSWLALMNLMLGAFNLLPGAPLDGGRVLRAWFWRRSGDRLSSQARAARAGRTLAHVLIAVGLVEFALGAGLPGLWLAFLGWFVLSAANAEELDADVRRALGGVRLGRLMTPDPVTVTSDLSLAELVERFLLRHRSSYPVVDAGEVRGLVELADVRRVPVEQHASTTVAQVMTPLERCAIAAPDDEAVEALARIGSHARVLVLEGGRLVGILTPTDLARLAAAAHLAHGR
jgi:Zn-dependent protease/CBS domain-containing protein